MNAELKAAHRREGAFVVRHRHGEVAPKADQRFGFAGDHGLQGFYRIVAMMPRRRNPHHPLQAVEESRGGFFADPDSAVTLDVRVTAQRTDPGPRLADIAAHQQQVGNQTHVGGAFVMLGDAHTVGDDGGPGFGVSRRNLGQGFARQARLLFDVLPAGGVEVIGEGGESLGMLGNKRVVEHIALLLLQLQQRFGDPFQRRRVAAGPYLVVGRGDRRRAPGRHLHYVLRIGKTLQRPFTQRIENDNRHAAAG